MPGMERSWADLLEPVRDSKGMEHGHMASREETKDTKSRSPSDTGIVDWDGDAPPREWRRGWGGFPGAKYLGIKDKTKTSQPSNPPEAGGESADEGERGGPETAPKPDAGTSDMKHSMHEQPATNPLRPAAK